MSHKPRFSMPALSLLTRVGILLGLFSLLAFAQGARVAASTRLPQGSTSCTNAGCHGQMGFTARSYHTEPDVTDNDCRICHAEVYNTNNHNNTNAVVDLLDPDSGAISTVPRIRGNRASLTADDITTLTTFCQNCHDIDGAKRLANPGNPFGDGKTPLAVGTHSNQDFRGVEADFHVGCIQCHASHGSDNLALIHSQVIVAPGVITGTVVFTAQIGTGSRDDGLGNGICVICHNHSSNPGYPMMNHSGGIHTRPSVGDKRGTDCSTCHPHEPDSHTETRNGHMPADANALGLHGLLAQSELWPLAGLASVLLAVIVELRKHREKGESHQ